MATTASPRAPARASRRMTISWHRAAQPAFLNGRGFPGGATRHALLTVQVLVAPGVREVQSLERAAAPCDQAARRISGETRHMPTRRSFIIALALFAAASPGVAAEQTAQDFLGAIYASYKGKDAKGVPLGSTAAINRYFTPTLARLIDADAKAAARRNEVGALGGDPFV